jgi:Protein of unknown function (DUF3987)
VKNNNNINDTSKAQGTPSGATRLNIVRQMVKMFTRKPQAKADGSTTGKGRSGQSPRREKRPLQRELDAAAVFPVQALGEVLCNAALALEEAIQAPIAICGNSVLAAAHLAAQAHANVVVDGRPSPISEFFITVGGSGERKSAVDRFALKEVRAHEKRLQDSFNAAMSLRAPVKKSIGGADDGNDGAETMAQLPPLSPVIICEEPTFEGLVKNLANGQPSQGLFSDEGGRFLGGYAMSSENAVATMAGFCKLWDGSALDRVRAGDGPMKLFGRRMSFHLMVQPGVVDSLIGNPLASDQGFLSRCLIAMPTSTIGARFYRAINLNASPAMMVYHDVIRALLAHDAPVENPNDEFGRSQLAPRELQLCDDAKQIFVAFHDKVEREMAGALKDHRAFTNKSPEHLLRIAGTLAIVESVHATEIEKRHAENARALMMYFLEEGRRLDEMARQDPNLRIAQKLLDWLIEQDRPVTLVEIYQNGPTQLRNAKSAKHFVGILYDHGQIEPVKGLKFRGKTRNEGWQLAP